MSFLAALRLLTQCPAIIRVGVKLVRELVDLLDEGRDEEAIKRIRQRQIDIAAGKARNASSRATDEMMRRKRASK